MGDVRKYTKGALIDSEQTASLANTNTKVIGVKKITKEEIIGTIVNGDFTTCLGTRITRLFPDTVSFRFDNPTLNDSTYCTFLYDFDLYLIEETAIVEDKPKVEFRKNSGVFFTHGNGTRSELISNCTTFEGYLENLKFGRSFYFEDSVDEYFVFSIEDAVKMRDYLTDMITLAEQSGYFEPKKEMTLEDIEKELGYKINLIEKQDKPKQQPKQQ